METISYNVSGTWTEVSFTALGVGINARMALGTHGESKFTLPLATLPPETAVAIPFEAPCIIYTGRTGSGGSWTGGSILFQGRRTDNSGQASASSASQELVIEDAWYDLRFLTLQCAWQNITAFTGTTPTYGTPYTWPDCVLFQNSPNGQLLPNGTFGTYSPLPVYNHITTGQTIEEILAYAIYFGGVNLQIGTLADCSCYVPFYPVRSMRCSEAIKIALRVHPDCTCEIDYTTTPPTFNIRKQANLTGIMLPYKGTASNRTHLTSQVRPRPELIPSRVGIYIKETSTINNNSVVSITTDIYPTSAPSGLRSLDASVDMCGPKLAKVTAVLTTAAFNPASLTWWAAKVPALQSIANGGQIPTTGTGALALLDSTVNGGLSGHPKGIQVVDDTNTPINISAGNYAFELLTGTPASWMQATVGGSVNVTEANVIGFFSYYKETTAGASTLVDQIGEHMHTVRVKLTNTASATFQLSTTLATGEVYPTGLAQTVYSALQTLQYNFSHVIQEAPYATLIKPGKHCLNLSGGASAWSTMNAMIQAVDYEFMLSPAGPMTVSKTTVHCGPVAHLDVRELVEIFNLFCNRDLSKINPNERLGGLDESGGQLTLGSDSPKENSVPAPPVPAILNVTAPDATASNVTNIFAADATAHQISVPQKSTSAGTTIITGLIAPEFNGSGSPSSTSLPANAYFRTGDHYVDTTANALWRCTASGSNSTSTWSQISGGGGAVQGFKLVSDGGDYYNCYTYDGVTTGSTLTKVAKTQDLRCTLPSASPAGGANTSKSVRGVTYTYTYTHVAPGGASNQDEYSRSVSGSDGTSETDLVTPALMIGDTIYAEPASFAGPATLVGVVWLALADGRAWSK